MLKRFLSLPAVAKTTFDRQLLNEIRKKLFRKTGLAQNIRNQFQDLESLLIF